MIRRGFWLAAGAAAGIYGYRRVSALGRRLSATLNPAGPADPAKLAPRPSRWGAVAAARQTIRFTRDVREGMDQYRLAHSAPEGSTLRARDLEPARDLSPDHDPQPEDGR
jgi:hypothetical protein